MKLCIYFFLSENSKFENGIKEAINAIVKNIKSGQMKVTARLGHNEIQKIHHTN